MNNFLAIDQGTTSTRAILFDKSLNVVKSFSEKLCTSFPNSGWVEQEPLKILQSVKNTINKIASIDIVGIGITNQRETVVIWDRSTGLPIYNAIIWQDRRTAVRCAELKKMGYEKFIKEKTGLLLDPYFSATKICWILDNIPKARADAENGKLAFGTIDSFLLWHLTNGRVHATDATNASRTMLYNIFEGKWDSELLKLFNIPESILPLVKDSSSDFSETSITGTNVPIRAMIGDQQAAAIGLGCFKPGMIKATFGTGCFALLNTGFIPKKSQSNLITTIAYQFEGKASYALEGSIFNVGTIIDWLKDNMNFINDYNELEGLINNSNKPNKVIFIPAFTGLGAPYWDSQCRGAIFGLERSTTVNDIAKAALQSITFQARDLFNAMCSDYLDQKLEILKVDGGVCRNNWLMQNLSNQIGIKVERPLNIEASAVGVAFLTGLSLGYFSDLTDLEKILQKDMVFNPVSNRFAIDTDYANWEKAVKKLLS